MYDALAYSYDADGNLLMKTSPHTQCAGWFYGYADHQLLL